MDNQFQESDLPIGDLRKLGLIMNGKPTLSGDDIQALLSGHRTDLITLEDLHADGIHIRQMDAKLSLERTPAGHITVQLHPIYRNAKKHPLLIDVEAERLELGTLSNVLKTYHTPDGKKKTWVIEYDPETREFISYDPDTVRVPDMVDGEHLSETQKGRYRNGGVVDLSDGTLLQLRASDRKGVISNRTALIYSLLLDGGISYIVLRALNNLRGSGEEQKLPSAGYQKTLQDKMRRDLDRKVDQRTGEERDRDLRNEHSRGYGKGHSR